MRKTIQVYDCTCMEANGHSANGNTQHYTNVRFEIRNNGRGWGWMSRLEFPQYRNKGLVTMRSRLTNSVAPELEGSSPQSRQPAKCPYPQPGESTPPPISKVRVDHILPSTPWSFKWSFPSAFPTKTLYTFSPCPCVPHAPPTSFSLIWSA
jgi:hypothetical protein